MTGNEVERMEREREAGQQGRKRAEKENSSSGDVNAPMETSKNT